jgi:hypothetical protein
MIQFAQLHLTCKFYRETDEITHLTINSMELKRRFLPFNLIVYHIIYQFNFYRLSLLEVLLYNCTRTFKSTIVYTETVPQTPPNIPSFSHYSENMEYDVYYLPEYKYAV